MSKLSTINSLSTFVISEMLNGRVIATLMVLVVVEVGLYLRAQARWVPYMHWGFSVRGTSLDTRPSAHYGLPLLNTVLRRPWRRHVARRSPPALALHGQSNAAPAKTLYLDHICRPRASICHASCNHQACKEPGPFHGSGAARSSATASSTTRCTAACHAGSVAECAQSSHAAGETSVSCSFRAPPPKGAPGTALSS